MRFHIITLFPEFFTSPLEQSIIGKALKSNQDKKPLIEVHYYNIRDYSTDKHRRVDDSPYGGGPGMVMMVEPLKLAIEDARKEAKGEAVVVLLCPTGEPLRHARVKQFSELEDIIIVCGRYEGYDERIRKYVDLEISIGDFIMTGAESSALCLIDAVSRFVPGVLGRIESSTGDESFIDNLLEYPQFTRPESFDGDEVPPVLLSGNHGEIKEWRRNKSIEKTLKKRPDLIEKACLTEKEKKLIKTLKKD